MSHEVSPIHKPAPFDSRFSLAQALFRHYYSLSSEERLTSRSWKNLAFPKNKTYFPAMDNQRFRTSGNIEVRNQWLTSFMGDYHWSKIQLVLCKHADAHNWFMHHQKSMMDRPTTDFDH